MGAPGNNSNWCARKLGDITCSCYHGSAIDVGVESRQLYLHVLEFILKFDDFFTERGHLGSKPVPIVQIWSHARRVC